MNKVFVERSQLIDILSKNKAKHVETYQKALIGFKIKYQKVISDMLEKSHKNKFIMRIALEAPFSHEQDYEKAIQMINLSVRNEIELTQKDFENYVLDNWSWSSHFFSNSSNYIECSSSTSSLSSSSLSSTDDYVIVNSYDD